MVCISNACIHTLHIRNARNKCTKCFYVKQKRNHFDGRNGRNDKIVTSPKTAASYSTSNVGEFVETSRCRRERGMA